METTTAAHTPAPELSVNHIDVDRLQYLWDLLHQTQTLCETLRSLIMSVKEDTSAVSERAMAMLQDRI